MRAKGITYDTGFVRNGAISREAFDPVVVKRELEIIRDDLHCTAVRKPPRRHLPRHALGTQGGLHYTGRVLPWLKAADRAPDSNALESPLEA